MTIAGAFALPLVRIHYGAPETSTWAVIIIVGTVRGGDCKCRPPPFYSLCTHTVFGPPCSNGTTNSNNMKLSAHMFVRFVCVDIVPSSIYERSPFRLISSYSEFSLGGRVGRKSPSSGRMAAMAKPRKPATRTQARRRWLANKDICI